MFPILGLGMCHLECLDFLFFNMVLEGPSRFRTLLAASSLVVFCIHSMPGVHKTQRSFN